MNKIVPTSLEAEISLAFACLDTTECLLKDLSIELVNSRLSFFNGREVMRESLSAGGSLSEATNLTTVEA